MPARWMSADMFFSVFCCRGSPRTMGRKVDVVVVTAKLLELGGENSFVKCVEFYTRWSVREYECGSLRRRG